MSSYNKYSGNNQRGNEDRRDYNHVSSNNRGMNRGPTGN